MRRTVTLVGIALALLAAGTADGAPKPAGVTWGSVHFTDPGKLGSWLSDRGVRYGDWARRHPAALYLLTHPAPRVPVATQRGVSGSTTTTTRLGAGVAVFLVLALLLVMVSAAGDVLVRLAGVPIDPERVSAARLGAAGGGLAVAIGTALAWWL
jgi:Na+-transporting methylmalonyl-CoA/oxaloacetate decarboxylase gamma subunit